MSKNFEVTIQYQVIAYRADAFPVLGRMQEYSDVVEAENHKEAIKETFELAKELEPEFELHFCSVIKCLELTFNQVPQE